GAEGLASCDQYFAVRQQCRRMPLAVSREPAGGGPSAGRGVVEFCAIEKVETEASCCDKHLTVAQQRRRVSPTSMLEIVGRHPSAASRVVKLCALETLRTTGDKHLAVG